MDVIFNSKFQEHLLKSAPSIRGIWMLYTNLIKLLPKKFKICHLIESNIALDLSDPAQFSIVNTRKGRHELGTVNFIKTYLPSNGIFIDIGANFGYFSCIASKVVGENGLVLAFEPGISAFNQLIHTIKRNQLFNVIPVNIALGDKEKTTIDMQQSWFKQNTSSYMVAGKSTLSHTFDAFTKKLLSHQHINMIKIDVEGAELPVLKGLSSVLSEQHPYIIVEPDDRSVERNGFTFQDIFSFLAQFNYQPVYALDSISGRILPYDETIKHCPIVFGKG